ncbi:MAG: alpha/beta hydrolase [Pseudomonadota bacterium]
MARPFDHLPPVLHRLGPPAGQARREVLLLHGAWHGPWCWQGLLEPLARAGFGLNLLELPGHGQEPWDLPWLTSLADYAGLARRAAGSLGQPVLVGHSMGGWLAQKILEVVDLPAALLAPLPGAGLPLAGLLRLAWTLPGPLAGLMLGRPLALPSPRAAGRLLLDHPDPQLLAAYWPRLCPEPARVALEMGLGLLKARPAAGHAPRLVVAGGRDRLIPVARQTRLAEALGARLELLPEAPHHLWLQEGGGQLADILLKFLEAC